MVNRIDFGLKKYSQGFYKFGALEQNQEEGYLYKCSEVDPFLIALEARCETAVEDSREAQRNEKHWHEKYEALWWKSMREADDCIGKLLLATLTSVVGWTIIACAMVKYGITGHVL